MLNDHQKRYLKTLKVGDVMNGKIVKITAFGALVNIGGINALLHNSDISHDFVTDANEILEVNKRMDVVILNIDYGQYKVKVGLKQLKGNPWEKFMSKYRLNDIAVCTVIKMIEHGIVFKLMPGINALLHNSEMVAHHTSQAQYAIDEVHQLKIKSIDATHKKIGLTLPD